MFRWVVGLRISAASLFILLSFFSIGSIAQDGASVPNVFNHTEALKKSQQVIGTTLSDYTFTGVNGLPVHLDHFQNKPLIISLVYTSCYHICQMTTQHLKKMVEIANESLGADKFNVITIGFDAMIDTPKMMDEYAKSRGIGLENWYFLSADINSAEKLIEELGFTYVRTSNGFDHTLQATLIDQSGKIYTQVYGESFDAPLLMEPLKELVYKRPKNKGIITNIGDRVRFFCTVYDPASGGYHFDYSLFVGMFIGFMIIAIGVYFLVKEYYITPRM